MEMMRPFLGNVAILDSLGGTQSGDFTNQGTVMSGNEIRLQAINEVTNRGEVPTGPPPRPLSEIWASDVFNLATMEEALSKSAFKAMKKTVQTGAPLDPSTADVVAAAMKDWALGKGVKFFSHIFYPMTNITAEKHDGFIVTNADGNAITEFTGSLLIKGEPDGSSFPERQPSHDHRRARLHGLGSDEPGLRHAHAERRDADDPERLHVLDRRGARQEDPAAALERGDGQSCPEGL